MSGTLLDAYAVIAVLRGEPAARTVRALLEDGGCSVHPLNLAEVLDRVARASRVDVDDLESDIALLGLGTTSVTADDLVEAGRWRARHYHRTQRPVSLADCVAAVHARRREMPLASGDAACLAMLTEEGGEVVDLAAPSDRR